jgi:hypothetical protein
MGGTDADQTRGDQTMATMITIRRDYSAKCWTATIEGGEMEARTRDAFDGNVLPLPFAPEAPAQMVLTATQAQYQDDPSVSVVIPILEMIDTSPTRH